MSIYLTKSFHQKVWQLSTPSTLPRCLMGSENVRRGSAVIEAWSKESPMCRGKTSDFFVVPIIPSSWTTAKKHCQDSLRGTFLPQLCVAFMIISWLWCFHFFRINNQPSILQCLDRAKLTPGHGQKSWTILHPEIGWFTMQIVNHLWFDCQVVGSNGFWAGHTHLLWTSHDASTTRENV